MLWCIALLSLLSRVIGENFHVEFPSWESIIDPRIIQAVMHLIDYGIMNKFVADMLCVASICCRTCRRLDIFSHGGRVPPFRCMLLG